MKLINFIPAVIMSCFLSTLSSGQPAIEIYQNGRPLKNPFSGGLNLPQFSSIDLDLDGSEDLLVFDRSGNAILPFLKSETEAGIQYHYQPRYHDAFPKLTNWVLCRDINCDGKKDIITSNATRNGIRIFANVSDTRLRFEQTDSLLLTQDSSLIYVPGTDIPAIEDIDMDGDLDILSFDANGLYVIYYQNLSVEHSGTCKSPTFIINTPCWGVFQEAGLDNSILLNQGCQPQQSPRTTLHAGSTLALLPSERDRTWDLLLGDISHENLVFLDNQGSSEQARIDDIIFRFPPSNPVSLYFFPAAFFLNLDSDSPDEMIVAPNAPNVSDNFDQIWLYKDTTSLGAGDYSLVQQDFLLEDMIDCGSNSHPVLWDYNDDGWKDLLIGNKAYQTEGNNPGSAITLYEFTGTATEPGFTLVSRDFLSISSLFPQPIQDIHFTIEDIDQDGTDDMILGDINGQIHWIRLVKSADTIRPELQAYQWLDIDVGQFATPYLFDINQDGMIDLITGELNGNINYFENIGDNTKPFFDSEPTTENWGGISTRSACCSGFSAPFIRENPDGTFSVFTGSEEGKIYRYKGITNLLASTFTLSDSVSGMGGRTNVVGFGSFQDRPLHTDSYKLFIGNSRGGLHFFSEQISPSTSTTHLDTHPQLYLFPNPSHKPFFTLTLPVPNQAVTIELFNSNGIPVYQQYLPQPGSRINIHIPGITPGLYYTQIKQNTSQPITQKWLYFGSK